MIISCATDDGINFVNRHFGDANYYEIYELIDDEFHYIDRITNTTGEEETHADPKKAKGIVGLLVEKNVTVGLTKVFGPNIKRVKKHFVPVLVSLDSIEEGLQKVLKAKEEIKRQIELGENRSHIDLR
ncbi:MAG: NifB/NifX family molybdenum-iron cluster-binding protein [Clostridiales bacterium]|nr:NifB/NifX family molybdenum-iron cluster-binding protein [Clostridiales bacterium]